MKLAHPDFEMPIEFNENQNNVLVIENPILFTRYITELRNQLDGGDGQFVLSNNGKEMQVSKTMELAIDWYHLDVNQRKVVTQLHGRMKKIALGEEFYLETQELLGRIQCFLTKLGDCLDYPIKIIDDLDVAGLMKMADVKIETEAESLLERITEYLLAMMAFCGIQCFVLVNMKNWMTEEEISEFYKFINYNKVNVLLIESRTSERHHATEKVRIIDADWCEL